MISPPTFRRTTCLIALLVMALGPLVAQELRGGLVPDTPVFLMSGTALVQDLQVGSEILTVGSDGKGVPGKIIAIRVRHADSYIQLKAGGSELEATDSHRVVLPGNRIVRLDAIASGQRVFIWGPKGREEASAEVREYPANLLCYNLTIEAHRPFVAGGIVVGD